MLSFTVGLFYKKFRFSFAENKHLMIKKKNRKCIKSEKNKPFQRKRELPDRNKEGKIISNIKKVGKNMIKVFLAENESSVRDTVRDALDRKNGEYEFVGEAADGKEAYTKILKEKPDILITDIQLPVIDGYKLSRLIRDALPDTKIIIISEYEDFEYMRLAVNLGVADYLLKPVKPEILSESLNQLREAVEKEKKGRRLQKWKKRFDSRMLNHMKVSLLNELLQGKISEDEAHRRAAIIGIQLGPGIYRFLFLRVWTGRDDQLGDETEKAGCEIEYCVDKDFKEVAACFRSSSERWVFLLHAESMEEIRDETIRLKNSLERIIRKYPGLEYFGGAGSCVRQISQLQNAFETADRIFSRRFISDPGQIIVVEDDSLEEKESLSTENLDKMEYSRLLIERFLVKGSVEELDSFIDFYFSEIPEEHFQSLLMRQYLSVDIFITINSFYKQNGIDRIKEQYIEKFIERIQRAHTLEQMKVILHDMLADTLERRNAVSGNKYTRIIETAKKYVEEHYMSENISLNSVATYVNMNSSYFSSVFRKETGRTFVEYLTEVRMEKARELLLCSSLKIAEIAYKVGYNDPQYFSYLFRKYNYCSPKEFRHRKRDI